MCNEAVQAGSCIASVTHSTKCRIKHFNMRQRCPNIYRQHSTILCTHKHCILTHMHTHPHAHTHVHATCWSRDGESPFWLKPNSGEQLNQRHAFDHLVMRTWQVTIWLIKCKWQSVLKTLWKRAATGNREENKVGMSSNSYKTVLDFPCLKCC